MNVDKDILNLYLNRYNSNSKYDVVKIINENDDLINIQSRMTTKYPENDVVSIVIMSANKNNLLNWVRKNKIKNILND